MTKYIIMKDYRNEMKLEYVDAQSNDIVEVMMEAERLHTEDIYLTMILEKVGKTERKYGGWKETNYTDVLEHRTNWHRTNYNYTVTRSEKKGVGVYYE